MVLVILLGGPSATQLRAERTPETAAVSAAYRRRPGSTSVVGRGLCKSQTNHRALPKQILGPGEAQIIGSHHG